MVEESFAFKIVLIGNENVGKTSICGRYVKKDFGSKYKPTLGVNLITIRVPVKDKKGNEIICAVTIWDIAGQEKYKSIRPTYYRGCSAVIIVYDVTKRRSFDDLTSWISDYEKYGDLPPLYFLVGNKNDLLNEKVVSDDDANAFSKKINAEMFIKMSAMTGENVDETFSEILKILIRTTGEKI